MSLMAHRRLAGGVSADGGVVGGVGVVSASVTAASAAARRGSISAIF